MFSDSDSEKFILIIESDRNLQTFLKNSLSELYHCETVDSMKETMIERREYPVIIGSSTKAKDNDLIEFAARHASRSKLILINENEPAERIIELFRAGVFDFVQRDFAPQQIAAIVERAFAEYETKTARDAYQRHLEQLASTRTVEINQALAEVENSYRMMLQALVQALETRDFETRGHSERAVTFSLRLGHELGLEKNLLRDLELGALLHDIGKIGVPDAILRKPAKLNHEEWVKMKLHPLHGQKILRNIAFLEGAVRIVAQHHEHWDGSGYPNNLRGEQIDFGARVFAVSDAFDAIVSDRIYRRGRSYEAAFAELERCAGTQFDPQVVRAFKNVPKEDWEILRERSTKERREILSFQAFVNELVYSHQGSQLIH